MSTATPLYVFMRIMNRAKTKNNQFWIGLNESSKKQLHTTPRVNFPKQYHKVVKPWVDFPKLIHEKVWTLESISLSWSANGCETLGQFPQADPQKVVNPRVNFLELIHERVWTFKSISLSWSIEGCDPLGLKKSWTTYHFNHLGFFINYCNSCLSISVGAAIRSRSHPGQLEGSYTLFILWVDRLLYKNS